MRCGGVRSLLPAASIPAAAVPWAAFKVLLVSIGPKPEQNPEPPVTRCRGAHADRSSDLRDMSQKPVLRSARHLAHKQSYKTKQTSCAVA